MQHLQRAFNFSPGPATLPDAVIHTLHAELTNWNNSGASVLETSHRNPVFAECIESTLTLCREVLNIPAEYKVWLMPGGGRNQFALIPLNLRAQGASADYIETGLWSTLALKEAQRTGMARVAASSAEGGFRTIPGFESWDLDPQAAYCHMVSNETVHGVEFSEAPKVDVPLIADMSSNIFSQPMDVSQYDMIYAATQKNMGIAGLSFMVMHEALLDQCLDALPSLHSYPEHHASKGMLQTPPTLAWRVTELVLGWLKSQGGLQQIEQRNSYKSSRLYERIDASDFYNAPVEAPYRSRMNALFFLHNDSLTSAFLEGAEAHGMIGLKGHHKTGGIRASLYNALPIEAVDRLIAYMDEFEKQHG